MKGCLDSIFILLLGAGIAAVFVWKAYQQPAPFAPQTAADPAAVRQELAMLKRQFQTTEDYQKRLSAQNLTEALLEQRVSTALAEQDDLEKIHSNIAEAEAQTWFNTHREALRIPETFHASHIFLTRHEKTKPDREGEIRAIHRQIQEGAITFREAAARLSEDDRNKSLAGDLGWFSADRMPADFIAAVRPMKPGEVSKPFLTALGWHIVTLLERKASRLPSYDEAKPEIQAMLQQTKR